MRVEDKSCLTGPVTLTALDSRQSINRPRTLQGTIRFHSTLSPRQPPHRSLPRATVTVSEIMEGNKDEALRCLSIAQKHRNAGNYTSAKKFIQKSLALFATSEAQKLAQIIESEASASTSTSTSKGTEEATKATGTEKHPSAGGTHHRHPNGNASTNGSAEGSSSGSEKKRDYTPDQLAVVKRVRTCKVTEYYEILALKKDCEEAEVKKAYRKVRVLSHFDCAGVSRVDWLSGVARAGLTPR